MADTIDRIQVEFSTNIQDFLTQLSGIESSTDSTAKTFNTAESASVRYSTALETTATAAASAVTSLNEYTTAATTQANAASAAAAETETHGKKTSELIENLKLGFGQLKTLLGVMGVSVGLGALISQVRELATEAEAAGKAYGKMYNTIYYTTGELTDSQKNLAASLKLEGFDTTDIAETISRLTALFPDAESTLTETGQTALAEMAEEVLWMDRKGYGEISDLIDGMNDAFKKWSIPTEDITGDLGYLAATYRDTNTDVSTLLASLTKLDEVGTTLGLTFRDMADFIGAANVAGNLDDLSNVGMRFESQYTARVSEIYNALLNADRDTLTDAGISADLADASIQQIIDDISIDESSAKLKAQELAETIVTAMFQAAHQQATLAETQAQASQVWADALDIQVGRITNRLADLSMSTASGYESIRTVNRDTVTETGQTTTTLVKIDKGLGTSDYSAANAAEWEKELSETWWAQQAPRIEKSINEYIQAGYGSIISSYLGKREPYNELTETFPSITALTNPVLGFMEQAGSDFYDLLISALFPKENAEPSTIEKWIETCADQLNDISGAVTGIDTNAEPNSTVSPAVSVTADITDTPEISVDPSIAVNPDISVYPTVSVHPLINIYPDIEMQTPAPSTGLTQQNVTQPQTAEYFRNPGFAMTPADTTTISPEIFVNPEISVYPDITVTPDTKTAERTTVYPEISVTPEITTNPHITVVPDTKTAETTAVYPEISVTPEITTNPHITVVPDTKTAEATAVYPEISVTPEITTNPHITVVPDTKTAETTAVYPEISVTPEISVYPDITVTPETRSAENIAVYPEISLTPEIATNPHITVVPDTKTAETTAVYPEISVTPEISVYPDITVTPETRSAENIAVYPDLDRTGDETETASPFSSALSAIASFFNHLTGMQEVPDSTAEIPESAYMYRSFDQTEPRQEDTASPVSSAFNSLLAAMDSGNTALTGSISSLNNSVNTLSRSLAGKGDVTVIQYISAPVADTYAIKNAAATAISAAQSGSYRL